MKLKEILLIDDSAATNTLNRRFLEQMNIVEKITIKLNGQEGLTYLTSKNEFGVSPSPNLIFLDINMPVMDGFQFLEKYDKLDSSLKAEILVIMLTSSINEKDAEKARKYDAVHDFMQKPLSEAQVNNLLDELSLLRFITV